MKEYTVDDILDLDPCYTEDEIRECFGARETMTMAELIKANIPDDDKIWVVSQFCDYQTRLEAAQFLLREVLAQYVKNGGEMRQLEQLRHIFALRDSQARRYVDACELGVPDLVLEQLLYILEQQTAANVGVLAYWAAVRMTGISIGDWNVNRNVNMISVLKLMINLMI